jgi:hypothetical protein
MRWSVLIDGSLSGLSHRCIVRGIATAHRLAYRNSSSFGRSAYGNSASFGAPQLAHRSCLVRSKGQLSATMVGINENLRGFFSIPGASRLRDACLGLINRPSDSHAHSRWSLA